MITHPGGLLLALVRAPEYGEPVSSSAAVPRALAAETALKQNSILF